MKNSKLLANNWVITLTATLIGVFLALYLNEQVASNKLRNQREIATENIKSEISFNKKNLEKNLKNHIEFLDFIIFSSKYTNEEKELIVPIDSMNIFRNKYPSVIVITDSVLISDGIYKYKGTSDFDEIYSLNLDLKTIAWESLRNSGLSTTIGYECLMYLQSIDIILNKIVQKNEIFFEYLLNERDSGIKNKKLIWHLELLVFQQKSLVEIYNRSDIELVNCD